MKTSKILNYLLMVALVSTTFISCSDDKDDPKPTSDFVVKTDDLKGEITNGTVVLEEGTYTLTGALVVKSGAKLVIAAGTKIVANDPTATDIAVRYIIVAQGAKIEVNGTAAKPVVMTSSTEKASSWGGLVICGNAPTNKGTSVTSEVGGLTYGGTVANDNSGTLRYLVVKYTGYKYTSEKEFNGISFFGVGSGTTVEYISSIDGGDDGIEFFGGTVNASYLVSVNSEDDGIDFADGWNGTGMNWYVKNAVKSGIEGSNNGDNGNATPMTSATLKNITLMGMGEKPWYFKEGAGKQTIDNVVIGGLTNLAKAPYLYIDATDTHAQARAIAKDIKITNMKFVDVEQANKANVNIVFTENVNATGAGNGIDAPTWAANWSGM